MKTRTRSPASDLLLAMLDEICAAIAALWDAALAAARTFAVWFAAVGAVLVALRVVSNLLAISVPAVSLKP